MITLADNVQSLKFFDGSRLVLNSRVINIIVILITNKSFSENVTVIIFVQQVSYFKINLVMYLFFFIVSEKSTVSFVEWLEIDYAFVHKMFCYEYRCLHL